MGDAAGLADFRDADADALAGGGHEHELVLLGDGDGSDDRAGLVGDVHRLDAEAAARLLAVVVEGGAFAEAVFRGDEQGGFRGDLREADDAVALARADAGDAHRRAAHRAGVAFVETQAHAVAGDEDEVVIAGGERHADEFVAILEDDGVEPGGAVVAEIVERGFLDLAGAGGEEHEAGLLTEGDIISIVIGDALEAQHGGDFFLRLEVEHVLDRAAGRGARTFGKLEHALDIHAAGVGEKEQIIVRLDGEQMLDEIIGLVLAGGLGLHALEALAAAALQAVFAGRRAFHVTAVGQRDDHRVVGDEVFHGHLAGLGKDRALARGGVFLADGAQLVLDDAKHTLLTGEDVEQVLDVDKHLVVFALHLVLLHAGELIEAEFEDGVHLALGEHVAIALHGGLRADEDAEFFRGGGGELIGGEPFAGLVAVLRIADDADEVVEVAERQQEGFEQFGAFLGLS